MAGEQTKQVLAFDVYGTLLNTNSIADAIRVCLHLDEEQAFKISTLWRRYQLEYTWRLNSMGFYESFDSVTKKSLIHAAAEAHVDINEDAVSQLLESYNHLHPFEDALLALSTLSSIPQVDIVIFSNGTEKMVNNALHVNPLSSIPHEVYFADNVKRYKPSPDIYHGLVAHLNTNHPEDTRIDASHVWLISGNPFDVTGARAAGLRAIWVDRARTGWLDRISPEGLDLSPTKIVHDLQEIAEFIQTIE